MSTPRYQFASEEWVAAFHGYLAANAGTFSASLDGASFAICEVYTGVPASVSRADRVAISWAIRDGALEFSTEERDDVVVKIVADWEAIAPLARIVFAEDPDGGAKAASVMTRGAAEGTIAVSQNGASPAFIGAMHDDIARMTV